MSPEVLIGPAFATQNTRAVTAQSGFVLHSGFESIFYWTRNWPGVGGTRIGSGPKWAANRPGLGADSSRTHENENYMKQTSER